ncbi:MAG: MBL fold metallo-hydrolase [Pseudomonadota bacterium]
MRDRTHFHGAIPRLGRRACVAVLILAVFNMAPPAASAQEGKREITRIAGDVYRFQNRFHFSIFVVTGDGVVVTDPINRSAAKWLEAEIGKRFEKPITHLIYSHSHDDHAAGGAIFADTALVIAQQEAPAEIDGVVPDLRFAEALTLTVGRKAIELTALGPGHGTDLIAMVIRPENVAFVVDAVAVKRLPYRDFPGADIDGWIEQVRRVEALEFDILAPGHGALGTKEDATATRVYMEDLRDQVAAALAEGRGEAQLAQDITMDAYSDWAQYDAWRELNVRGMARWLKGRDSD